MSTMHDFKPIIMKTLFITSVAFFTIMFTIQAQETQFGLKAGLNLASLTNDTSGLKLRNAFHIGVMAEIPISELFSIQPELLYSAQGAKADGDQVKIDYLNLPVMFKYYVAQDVSFEAGPQIGFLLSATSEIDDQGDIKEEVEGLDFGLNFGLGYKMDSGLNVGVRYNLGIANIFKSEDEFDDDYKVNNSVFQFYLGFMF